MNAPKVVMAGVIFAVLGTIGYVVYTSQRIPAVARVDRRSAPASAYERALQETEETLTGSPQTRRAQR